MTCTTATVLNLVGLSCGLVGAGLTAASPFLTKDEAVKQTTPETVSEILNPKNVTTHAAGALLRQSGRARCGLFILAAGFLLQGLAAILS